MDQLIYASLSHTHYWYEVGMLKVPGLSAINVIGTQLRDPMAVEGMDGRHRGKLEEAEHPVSRNQI